jgi:hypothetical protein
MGLTRFQPYECELCGDPEPVATPYGPLCTDCCTDCAKLREHELGNWCNFDGGN